MNLVFLVLSILSFLISYFRREGPHGRRNKSWDSFITALLCSLLSISCFSLSFWVLFGGNSSFIQLHWMIYFVRGIIWISLAFSLFILPPKWLQTVLLSWWIIFSVSISAFNLELFIRGSEFQILDLISWPVNLLLIFCAFKLIMRTSFNENPERESLSSPLLLDLNERRTNLSKASLYSRLTFSWLNPLLRLGSSKPLALEDIPVLDSNDEAFLAYQTFYRAWELERKNRSITRNLVLNSLAKCYKKEMFLVGLYALLKSVSVAASPLILYAFILFSNREKKDLKFGIFLIICLACLKFVESISQRHWFFDSRRFGMRMRSAVMAAIFQKQLRLSSQGRRRHSTGEIVNYVAVDAYRLGEFPWWFHMAWSCPLQILLSIIVLFITVGVGTLPGLVPLVIFGFLNVPIAKTMQYYQAQFMLAQDERLRATSEVLNNMKIIKLQTWEEKFRRMVESLRDVEFKCLKDIQITKAYGSALYWMAPTVVSAVIFAGTAALKSASLNAGTIFTVLATLRVMSEPIRMLPEALSVLIQVKISLDRIDVFLLEDEIKDEIVQRSWLNNFNHSIQLHDGCFSWESDAAIQTLQNINLNIRKGEKIAVCGPVGAGKSSLIYAILGEIPKVSGSVS